MPPPRPTGLHAADAADDFSRARRSATLGRAGRLVRGGDVDPVLPFEEVVAALGRVGERDLGVQRIDLRSIVGTVDRPRGFDRAFRPTTSQVRGRWERIAAARRRGEALPPIQVFRVGEVHFVRDGHHRVSVARAQGDADIDAHVREVRTRVGADRTLRLEDLPLKGHERLFHERVPLAPEQAARVVLSDPLRYGDLAEGVEAWGFRHSQERDELLSREEVARAWFEREYQPVVELLREAGMVGAGTEADAFERIGGLRYRLMRHGDPWTPELLAELRARER